jgi:predicted  nucleic acid-binding Zn-ribbon protein
LTPELEALWRAQSLDRALLGVRERLSTFPARLARVDQGLAGAKAAVAAAEGRVQSAALAKREAEKSAEGLVEQERKFQTQLTQVKKNEEYAALLHEIAATQKKRSELETFVLEKMEQEAAVAADVARAKAALAEAEKGTKGERSVVTTEQNAAKAEEAALIAQRDEALSTLPATLRARYERILIARKGQAIAALSGDSCAGCGARMPAQAAIQVRRGLAVVECPDCGRLLIHPPGEEASTR